MEINGYNQVNFSKKMGFDINKYSNPKSKINVSNIKAGTIHMNSYKPSHLQVPKYQSGHYVAREVQKDTGMRVSPFGLSPGITRPLQGNQWFYDGSYHTFAQRYDYNLDMNKRY